MGLFSTKKKHTVNTTVTRLMDDKSIKDSVKEAVVVSLIQSDNQIVENILEGMISSVGVRAHQMYRYGGNHYTYGRPSLKYLVSDEGDSIVAQILEGLIGVGTTVAYAHYAPLNKLHIGWSTLVNSYGYKSSTNALDTLSALKGTPVYLKDMRVVVTSLTLAEMGEDGLLQWGTSANAGYTYSRPAAGLADQVIASPMLEDPLATEDSIVVTYEWLDGTIQEDSFIIPLTDIEDIDYFQAKYSFAGNDGYWTYESGLGTYPDLDALFDPTVAPFGSFFPFSYFRYEKQSMAVNTAAPGYLTSKKMLKYLGINYADMIESIHDNPDIGDVEQAMMIMAVPANSTNQIEQRYLFDFFSRMHLNEDIPKISSLDMSTRGGFLSRLISQRGAAGKVYVIQDSRFKMSVGCTNVYKRTRCGVVAAVGKYSSTYAKKSFPIEVTSYDEEGNEITSIIDTLFPTHTYRHQITNAVYEEIEVTKLNTRYYVWGRMTTVGDETDPTLLIPLDYSITSDYNIPDREELYSRGMHLVFNSHTITKIKWYQTGIFKVIMVVFAIVIGFYTGQFQVITAALAAGGAAVATLVFTMLLKYILISFAIKLFVKILGVKFAFIVAVLAVVAAMYGIVSSGSLTGAPWANDLLQLATNLSNGIGDAIQQSMIALQKEAVAFGAFAESQLELLEKANDLLNTSVTLSPFVIFGESPDDFYNRTVHSGNIGVSSIDAVSSYVDIALRLPELADTIG